MTERQHGGTATVTGRTASAALPPVLRLWLGSVAVIAALVVAGIGFAFAGESESGALDSWLVDPTADSIGPPWRAFALAVDFLGEPVGAVVLVAAVAAGCLLLRSPRAAVLVVASAVVAVGVAKLLKYVVGRTIHGPENLSYPSGHTTFLTALALALALFAVGRFGLGRAAGLLLVLGAALVAGGVMGWAEAALSAHYPTDAVGGWCTALAVVPATAWVVDKVADAGGTRG
ncbi:membrane protein [Streptomyces spiroverticillatus]|uniref:Membrane protein n=1 Tax=Streptomyces finlayi TaxID=67296 RepID=A0A919CDQ4_9ACTN|nr:phosphatase PAP2 family protein [Streptomyces finlayi]GHA27205.1 membrane protein [Streptomyces spiroverticillatus]GHD08417.1 membrane protein [Streptomyces finlayi]